MTATDPQAQVQTCDLLITDCAVLNPESRTGLEYGQQIAVQGNTIQAVSPHRPERAARTINGRGKLAVPGLVNAHTHISEYLARATSERLPLELWLLHLFSGLPTAFSERQIYLNAALSAVEMIRTGATAVLEHFWMSPEITPSGLEAVMRAFQDVGLRAVVAPMVDDLNAPLEHALASGFEMDDALKSALGGNALPVEDSLGLLEGFFERWHGAAGGRLQVAVGPGNVISCTPGFWVMLKEFAARRRIGLHGHAVETRFQATIGRALYGKSCVQMLHEHGILGPDVSLAHCVWLDDGDLELLAASGATLVHNPASNLKLGSGLAPIPQALQAGVKVALGSDGSASSDNQSIIDAMRLVSLIHTLGSEPGSWPSAHQALEMSTRGGAGALGLEDCLGAISAGMLADISLLDLENTFFTPRNDPVYHLVYCEPGSSVRTVVIDGQVVMEDGELTTVDEKQLIQEATESWQQLGVDQPEILLRLKPQMEALDRFRTWVQEG